MSEEKVYCKNCRWYKCGWCCVLGIKNKYFTEQYLNHKGKKVYSSKNKTEADYIRKKYNVSSYIVNPIECCNFNENYDCLYYKRKWWKFWVKK